MLPKKVSNNKQLLKRNIIQFNIIRRKVMHSVKGVDPTEEEFEFVKNFKEMVIPDTY